MKKTAYVALALYNVRNSETARQTDTSTHIQNAHTNYDNLTFSDDNCELNSCEEEVEDERLRLTDPKMVELIRSEIMDQGPPVEWNDIAGLDYAKSTIQVFIQSVKNQFIFT